jgi:hypothetical protein
MRFQIQFVDAPGAVTCVCGKQPELIRTSRSDGKGMNHFVRCESCRRAGNRVYGDGWFVEVTDRQAVEEWNTVGATWYAAL